MLVFFVLFFFLHRFIDYQFSVFDLVQINSLLFCFLKLITYLKAIFSIFPLINFRTISIYPWIGQYTIYALFKNLHLISNDCFCHMLSAFKKVQFLSFNFIPYWGKTQIFFHFSITRSFKAVIRPINRHYIFFQKKNNISENKLRLNWKSCCCLFV